MSDKPKQTIRREYDQSFLKELSLLNPAQKEAVNSIEGPVLVVAGPGTGKTHILSARIGQILMKTDTQAHNILCLTYTDAGVHAMRERLLQFIGPEGHKIHIYTFHSFCNTVIQDNLEIFGRHDLEPISDLERVELIRDIIDKLPHGHEVRPLKGDIYLYEKRLRDLFDRMKSESWTPEHVSKQIDLYLEMLPDNPEYQYKRAYKKFKKGEPRMTIIQKKMEQMERLRAGGLLYPEYQKQLDKRKRYDYGDMIQWVLKAFKETPNLLREYQEQYLYILVDEFQDTNGSQSNILTMLTDYWEKPNVFVVGDDDQSIYEFQGARVKNIIDFHQLYKEDIQLIILKENYRSSQHILNTAGELISNNEIRLVNQLEKGFLDKDLRAAHLVFSKSKIKPRIVSYFNPIHEDADIVQQIERLKKKKIPLSDVAIIYARHRQARNIIDLFERKEIPYNARRRVNVLELPMIQNIISLLKFVRQEFERPSSAEELFFEIMHYHFIGIHPHDLARMSIFMARDKNEKIQVKKPENFLYWRDVIADEELLKGKRLRNVAAFGKLDEWLTDILSHYANLQVPVLLERIINRSGLLRYITLQPDKTWLIQVLSTFMDFVQKEALKNPKMKVRDLLDIINRMESNQLQLSISQALYSEDGVNLITAHSAKGLEFRYVFIINAIKEYWEPSRSSGMRRFSFPDTLTFSGEESALEASRRLFYVALTRAKEQLHISYCSQDLFGKAKERARFIDELLESGNIEAEEESLADNKLVAAQILLLTEVKKPRIKALPKEEVKALLEGFTLSPTSLCRYLECRLSFYYQSVLKIPSLSSEAAAYGTAVHYALKRLFEKMKANEKEEFPSLEEFLKDFIMELERHRTQLTRQQFKNRISLGKLWLPKYYEVRIKEWSKEAMVERDIRNVEIDGVPIKGTVDKMVFRKGNKIHVVDYKTGTYRPAKISPPTDKKPLGGDYWRQVIFYKLLLENYRNYDWQVASGEVDYVDPDRQKNEFIRKEIPFSQDDVATVRKQITESYQSIMDHDFYRGCGKPTCKWCNFVTKHIDSDSYYDPIKAELDD